MRQEFYAHSLPGQPKEKWHELREHLQITAKLVCAGGGYTVKLRLCNIQIVRRCYGQ